MLQYENFRRYDAIFIFLLGLLISTFGLSNHEFVEFESRFGLFAQEMLRNGISFFPTTYNRYYPDYPATQTILTYLLTLPFGKVSFLTAILPTATATAFTLMFTYLIGSLQSRVWGWYGILFALLTYNFLSAARTITLDQFTTAVTAACFYCCYSAQTLHQPKRFLWLPITWLLGFMFRGPIGFVIPASVTVGYFLIARNFKAVIATGISAALLLTLSMLGLLAAAWYQGGKELLDAVINMQITSRLHAVIPYPFYEYIVNGFTNYVLAFPIACLVIVSYAKRFLQTPLDSQLNLLRQLAVWFLIILIGLSIPSAKKIRYLLPTTPAIALITAYVFITLNPNKIIKILRGCISILCASLPYVGLILLAIVYLISLLNNQVFEISYLFIAVPLISLSVAQLTYRKKVKDKGHQDFANILIGTLAFILIYALVAQPIDTQFNRAKPFVEQVEKIRLPNQPIVFYKINSDGAAIKFMVALDKPIQPKFLLNIQELQNFNIPAIFITTAEEFTSFPLGLKKQFTVLHQGRLGHLTCIVFIKRA